MCSIVLVKTPSVQETTNTCIVLIACKLCVLYLGVPVNCLSSEFECKQSGMCIARSRVCDYQEDCTDGSDEETCAGKMMFLIRIL